MRRLIFLFVTIAALLGATPAAASTAPPKPRPPATAMVINTASPSTVLYVTGDSRVATTYLPAESSFTTQLGLRMCGAYCNTAGHPAIVNAARGGQRLIGGNNPSIPDLSVEWRSILTRSPKPTTILVAIGVNDMGRIDDAIWAQAYRDINAQAAAVGVRVIPCTMIPLATWFTTYALVTPHLRAMNDWIRSYFGAPTCDMYAKTVDPAGPWLPAWADSGDGIHPNPAGVKAMAAAVPLSRIL